MAPVRFRDMPPARWRSYIDINLYGSLHCIAAVIEPMVEAHWGRIIQISSGAGRTGLKIGVSLYGASKSGIEGFIRHLSTEVASTGVTANALALGLMAAPNKQQDATVTAGIARTIPVGRLGTPDDVGAAVVFLASNEMEWMTGQTVNLERRLDLQLTLHNDCSCTLTRETTGGPRGNRALEWRAALWRPGGSGGVRGSELDELGYTALWIPDVSGDVFTPLDNLLGATKRTAIATGILNLWMTSAPDTARAMPRPSPPMASASCSASASAISCSSTAPSQPGTYQKPLAVMTNYLDELDALPNQRNPAREPDACRARAEDARAGGEPYPRHPHLPRDPEHTAKVRAELGSRAADRGRAGRGARDRPGRGP